MAEYHLEIRPPSGRRMFTYEVGMNACGFPWVVRVSSIYATEDEAIEAGQTTLRWFRDDETAS